MPDIHPAMRLYAAARAGNAQAVRAMIDRGYHLRSCVGGTALEMAVKDGQLAAVKVLVKMGGDARLASGRGGDPAVLELAKKSGHKNVADSLRNVTRDASATDDSALSRRGVLAWDIIYEAVRCDAPVEAVAGPFAGLVGAKAWLREAAGKSVVPTMECYLVFRVRGYGWGTVLPWHVQLRDEVPQPWHPRELARRLNAAAVCVTVRQDASALGFRAYAAGGELVEVLEHTPAKSAPARFDAEVRALEPVTNGKAVFGSKLREARRTRLKDVEGLMSELVGGRAAALPMYPAHGAAPGFAAMVGVMDVGTALERCDYVAVGDPKKSTLLIDPMPKPLPAGQSRSPAPPPPARTRAGARPRTRRTSR